MNNIKNSFLSGLVFLSTVSIGFISFATWNDLPTQNNWDTMTSTIWNNLIFKVNSLWQEVDILKTQTSSSNVISKEYTDIFSTTSNTWIDVPNFTISIKPSSSSSKILVISNVVAWMWSAVTGNYRIVRDTTPIAIPPTVAWYTSVWSASFYGWSNDWNNNKEATITYLDSPWTTNTINYKIQVISLQSWIMKINALWSDAISQNYSQRTRSSLTLMEIK